MRRILLLALTLTILTPALSLMAQGTPGDSTNIPTRPAPTQFDSGSVTGKEIAQKLSFFLGLNVGLTSGAGIDVGAMFPVGVETHANFFAISIGGYFHYNVGVEGRYDLIRKKDWQLYALLGMSYYSSELRDDKEAEEKPGNRVANPFRLGTGIGYGFYAGDQFIISLSGALTVFPTTGEVLPIPQLSMGFVF